MARTESEGPTTNVIERHINGRRYLQFPRLAEQSRLIHAFSTRPLDVSARFDERSAHRAANRAAMIWDLHLPPQSLRYCVQVHQTRLAIVNPELATPPAGPVADHDGLATNHADIPLMTFSADCPLVLLFDRERAAVGIAHASWRCTTAGIVPALLDLMIRNFGTRPADVLAGIGPGAGPCCYEVKDDVYAAAADLPDRDSLFPRRDGNIYFDLWQANRRVLMDRGVPPTAIEIAGVCTMCCTDLLYSFRREGAGCGHFGLIAALRG